MAVLCTENARNLFGFVQMTKEIEKNYPGLVDFGSGTTIVPSNPVKMRLSYKDLLLLIGILVAVIIAFTTLIYHDSAGESKQTLQKSSTESSASLIVRRLFWATSSPHLR